MTCEQRLKGVFQIDIQHRSVGHSALGVGRLRQLIALRHDRINHVPHTPQHHSAPPGAKRSRGPPIAPSGMGRSIPWSHAQLVVWWNQQHRTLKPERGGSLET